MHVFKKKKLALCQTHTTRSMRAMRMENGKELPKIIQIFNDRTSFFPANESPGESIKELIIYSDTQILASKYSHFHQHPY